MGKQSDYNEENYKTDFEICMEDSKLQLNHKNNVRSWPPLDLTPVGAKKSDTKTPAIVSSNLKGKKEKYYLPENPASYPGSSDSLSSDSNSSDNSNYKRRRRDNRRMIQSFRNTNLSNSARS